jgi:hypothetical protein
MAETQPPKIPDLIDGLFPAPALDTETSKLCAWLLKQEQPALREIPVSALGALAEYLCGRIHEDRCDRFMVELQERRERRAQETWDVDRLQGEFEPDGPRVAPLPVPVGGLETMWRAPGNGLTEVVPELDIPRPLPSQS